jgi:tRNA-dihydrouridine synthase 1|tara:strand:+ start:866 stop:1030 length:165 start_codon:yes stop_codon:yes gene_type:complete
VLDDPQRTIELARMLQDAGCTLLTVHGRTLAQKGRETGAVDWAAIARVRQAVLT